MVKFYYCPVLGLRYWDFKKPIKKSGSKFIKKSDRSNNFRGKFNKW